jgi:hypothetical protein
MNIDRNRRPFGEGLEETAIHIARMPPFYNDDERPVRQHASPPLDRETRLAFAVMLEMVDRIDEVEPGYCDAPTVTGRAFQAAVLIAKAHQLKMTSLGTPETISAGIVIELIGGFIASKPARQSAQWDERSQLRNLSSLLLLAGVSSYSIGDRLGLDPSALRKRLKTDLDAIDHKFGHFCKNNKSLRRKWPLPQKPVSMCYNDDRESPKLIAAAAILAGIDPDWDAADDPSEKILSSIFD